MLWAVRFTALGWFKKTLTHLRRCCSFVHLYASADGLHWFGISAIDELCVHVHMPPESLQDVSGRLREVDLSCDAAPVCERTSELPLPGTLFEINMLLFCKVIKRAMAFRYDAIDLYVRPASAFSVCARYRTTSPGEAAVNTASDAHFVLHVRCLTANKHDVYTVRCAPPDLHIWQTFRSRLHTVRASRWADYLGPSCAIASAGNEGVVLGDIATMQLHDALIRFHPDAFPLLTLHIRTVCTVPTKRPAGHAKAYPSPPQAPVHVTYISLHGRAAGMKGRIRLQISPEAPHREASLDPTKSSSARGTFLAVNLIQCVRYAMVVRAPTMHLMLVPLIAPASTSPPSPSSPLASLPRLPPSRPSQVSHWCGIHFVDPQCVHFRMRLSPASVSWWQTSSSSDSDG